MFVTTPRASAWRDPDHGGGDGGADASIDPRRAGAVRTLYAIRPFDTPAGRCLALRLVAAADGATSARLLVLFESRYARRPRPRWVPVESVLTEADGERWAQEGFRR